MDAVLIDELSIHATKPEAVNGRLYLTGIDERVDEQMVGAGRLHQTSPVRVYAATPILGESTRQAIIDARAWLVSASDEAAPRDDRRPDGDR